MRLKTTLMRVGVAAFCTALAGCGTGYYWQASMGHLELMRQRRPVVEVVSDPATPESVRAKLNVATAALDFAHTTLGLPDNGSYTSYADTGRASVVWNVVAAPEFSLQPRTWCFPVAGCVSYRGYFDATRAQEFADGLAADGDDIFVGGVAAYSTLGRFEDPLLNTMIGYSDMQVAGLIFHELAHQLIYVQDDSKFNEGFASFVEQRGMRRWLESRAAPKELCRYAQQLERRAAVDALLTNYRTRLDTLYARDVGAAEMRADKAAVLAELVTAYSDLRGAWSAPPYFDDWFDGAPNNARLAALATYDDYVPAFAVLFNDADGTLDEFYGRASELAELETAERSAAMRELGVRATDVTNVSCPRTEAVDAER